MARPKKRLDAVRILKLREAGLTLRQIADNEGASPATIYRVLKQNETRTNAGEPGGFETSPGVLKQATDVMVNHGSEKPAPPASSFAPSTNTPPALAPVRSELPQLGVAHHIAYSIAYIGNQPTNSAKWSFGNTTASRYEGEGYVINAYKNRLVVWISGIKGDNSAIIAARSKGKARSVLGTFALERSLKLDWSSFNEKSEPHFNLGDEQMNAALIPVIAAGGSAAKGAGILPGDASHPDSVEFTGRSGREAFDSLSWLLNDFPKDWAAERQVVKDFSENLRSHLAAINELRDTMKEMRTLIKEMRTKGIP